jgi:hypothetical protein
MLRHIVIAMLLGAVVLSFVSQAQAQNRTRMTAARAAAIHECSVLAGRYNEMTWGSTELYIYRSCMARHGYVE